VAQHASVNPCSTRHGSVVPQFLKIVKDNISICGVAVERGVEPPDFVKLFYRGSKNLPCLVIIKVIKDIPKQVAGERLRAPVISVKLIRSHPIGNPVRIRNRTVTNDGNIVRQDLTSPHNRRAKVLQRIQGGISPDKDFLPCLYGGNNFRAVRKA